MFTITRYYYPSPPLWGVMDNSMSSFWDYCNYHKVFISVAVFSLLAEPFLGGTPGLPVVHLILVSVHRINPNIVPALSY